jgi:hypothetical protein
LFVEVGLLGGGRGELFFRELILGHFVASGNEICLGFLMVGIGKYIGLIGVGLRDLCWVVEGVLCEGVSVMVFVG